MVHDARLQDLSKSGEEITRKAEAEETLINAKMSHQDEGQNGRDEGSMSPASSSNPNQNDAKLGQDQDVEALSIIASNLPPYSVFSKRKKHFIVLLAAWGGFFSPLSANIYFPALTTLAREFNVSSTLMNLTLTSYMIFQGLAPTIFGDLADMA